MFIYFIVVAAADSIGSASIFLPLNLDWQNKDFKFDSKRMLDKQANE